MVFYIIMFETDVIGHVVEKDDVKEIDKNGSKHKLIDIVFQDLE